MLQAVTATTIQWTVERHDLRRAVRTVQSVELGIGQLGLGKLQPSHTQYATWNEHILVQVTGYCTPEVFSDHI